MNINTKSANEHIKLLHHAAQGIDGTLVLASYGEDPATGDAITPEVYHFEIGDIEGMSNKALELAQEKHRNVYAPLAVLNRSVVSRGKVSDYIAVFGVVADFDDEEASNYLTRLPMLPSMVIGSSEGRYQAVYLFNKPVSTSDAKPIAAALQEQSGCDACSKDVIHVWRVAGCLNWPNKKKVAEGRSPVPQAVTILAVGDAVDPEVLKSSMPVVECKAPQPPTEAAPMMPTANLEKVKAALKHIPADLPYSDWVKILAALHSEGLIDLAHSWSAGDSRYAPDEVNKKWASFEEKKPAGVTIGTLFHMAKEHGWTAMDDAIPRLAKLSLLEYDKVRQAEAKALGVRAAILDTVVIEARKEAQEQQPMFAAIEPWTEPVNGGELLEEIVAAFNRYIVTPQHAPEAAALWLLNTYVHDASYHSPMVLITSPEKRCGKSTMLSLLYAMSNKALLAANISPAAVYRAIEQWNPTLLIDEADTFLKQNDDMAGVINSGHTKTTAFVMRCDGDTNEVRAFSTWCPKVIAGIGSQRDTLEDRSICIPLRRKLEGESVERLRLDRNNFDDIKRKCARWAEDNYQAVYESDPATPKGLHDRAADNWTPLLAIADLCGWREKTEIAALALSGADESESINSILLEDIRGIFRALHTERLSSQQLCNLLAALDDRPWGEWSKGRAISTNKLASRLKSFGVHSKTMRLPGGERLKGYELKAFSDVFTRYIPDSKRDTVTIQQPQQKPDFSKCDNEENVTFLNRRETLVNNNCHDVTPQNEGSDDSAKSDVLQVGHWTKPPELPPSFI